MNLLHGSSAVPPTSPCWRAIRASAARPVTCELGLDARAVPLDRANAEVDAFGDLAVGVAEREQREDLALAAAELVGPAASGSGVAGGRLPSRPSAITSATAWIRRSSPGVNGRPAAAPQRDDLPEDAPARPHRRDELRAEPEPLDVGGELMPLPGRESAGAAAASSSARPRRAGRRARSARGSARPGARRCRCPRRARRAARRRRSRAIRRGRQSDATSVEQPGDERAVFGLRGEALGA